MTISIENFFIYKSLLLSKIINSLIQCIVPKLLTECLYIWIMNARNCDTKIFLSPLNNPIVIWKKKLLFSLSMEKKKKETVVIITIINFFFFIPRYIALDFFCVKDVSSNQDFSHALFATKIHIFIVIIFYIALGNNITPRQVVVFSRSKHFNFTYSSLAFHFFFFFSRYFFFFSCCWCGRID